MPADRATSETDTPGSSDAATRRSFSSRDQRRRLSTDVITSTRGIVIGLLLGLSLGLPTFALSPQGGLHRRGTAKTSFETYKGNSPAGVASLSEVVEGMVMKAAKDSVKKGWMTKADAKGALASVLLKMKGVNAFNNADATLSSAQAFVSRYRNVSHHFPKNKKQAHVKYRDCRHGFLEGLRILQALNDSMKAAGLTGTI